MTADREAPTRRVHFKLNGRQIAALDDENILHAAARNGVEIPHLCYSDGMRSDGNCRACMVEIEGERVLAPACIRRPSDNMIVYTNNKRALHSQKLVLELLKSDMEAGLLSQRNEVEHWSHRLGLGNPRFKRRANPPLDVSHPAITVNLGACIHCTRCVRACREEQVNDVIGFAWRGAESAISFDLAGRGAGRPDSPPFRTHRAQFGQ